MLTGGNDKPLGLSALQPGGGRASSASRGSLRAEALQEGAEAARYRRLTRLRALARLGGGDGVLLKKGTIAPEDESAAVTPRRRAAADKYGHRDDDEEREGQDEGGQVG